MSASVNAGSFILNEYNVVTIEDLTFESHIYGKTFVGGDLIATNAPNFADRVAEPFIDASLQVAGDVNLASNISVKGHMEVGLSNTIELTDNGNKFAIDGREISNVQSVTNVNLDVMQVSVENELKSASTAFASLADNANNTITTSNNNQVTLSVDQSLSADDYAVFNLDNIEQIFNTDNNLQIEMQANNIDDIAGVIINVPGDTLALQTNANFIGNIFNNSPTKILWNFIDATAIDLAAQRFFGSILAPFAELTTNQNIEGSVGVYSIAAAKEIHNFNTTVTPPVVTVPEPNVLFLLAVIILLSTALRRYSSAK